MTSLHKSYVVILIMPSSVALWKKRRGLPLGCGPLVENHCTGQTKTR